jgi:outer membrane protein assembly factor BamB
MFGLASAAPAVASGEWPQFQKDAAHTGTLEAGVQAPFKEAWHLEVPAGGPQGRYGLSAPVLDGDTLMSVGPDQVIGVDAATGRLAWSVHRDYGPSVSPAVASLGDKKVLVYTEGFGSNPPGGSVSPSASASSSTDSASTESASARSTPSPGQTPSPAESAGGSGSFDSHVAAIDLATRKPVWDPIQLEQVSRTGVTVEAGMAFVGDNAGAIHAIDIATGRQSWTAETGGYVDTPLAVSNGRVYVSVQGSSSAFAAVVALSETDGSKVWRYSTDGEVLATAPTVAAGSVYVGLAGASSTLVRALDASSGAVRWSSRVNTTLTPVGAPAAASGGVIAQDVNSQIYRFDASTGSRTWDFALNEQAIQTSPVLSGGQVLSVTDQGRLTAIDASTGELVWQSSRGDGLLRDPLVTPESVVVVRGTPLAGLVAFEHDPAGSLVRLASPTTLDPIRLLGGFVLGAIPLAAALFILGRLMAVRAGPEFEALGGDEDEPGSDEESSESGDDGGDEQGSGGESGNEDER